MKKQTIWFLTVIMALTFLGLLFIQIMYVENMEKMRREQLTEGIKRSLFGVSRGLENEETRRYLEQDINESASFIKNTSNHNSISQDFTYSILSPDGTSNLTIEGSISKTNSNKGSQISKLKIADMKDSYRNMQESIKEQYLHQQALLNEVVINILSQSSDIPISERADSLTVNRLITTELKNFGIELPFEFCVANREGKTIYATRGFQSDEESKVYSQILFPNDPVGKVHYLKVYFPTFDKYVFSSVQFMIPSFAFTIILLIVFLYTIIVAFRQKKLTEMKNDFINNMTHEFKTPLSTIYLAAQMLNDDSVRKSPAMLQHISGVINDETKRLRFQVEKVLQLSMYEDKKATLKIEEIDANSLVANVINTFKLKVEKYGGAIETNINAENGIINADEMHFTNVIFNLLDNAVKYRREEVPLQLFVSTENIGEEKLKIKIADNGIGMRHEDTKKVFDKFYRVNTGNRHDVKGFGLGLAYVKKMITELGGTISISSELGIGTTFTIIMPLS